VDRITERTAKRLPIEGTRSSCQSAHGGGGPSYAPPAEGSIHLTAIRDLFDSTARPLKDEDQFGLFGSHDRKMPLYCAGDRTLLQNRCVAIVGTRKPSKMGAARARRLARELVRAGVVIVSGLAGGIDTEALVSAIKAGGRVVGVIGTPLDKVYPVENGSLQEQIYRDHLLVSQFASSQQVSRSNFPIRNRLMAALTDATAIVEASDSSGTLHLASECVRLGRWLFLARSIVDDPRITWPSTFLNKPRTRVLASTEEILSVLND
jgi:DNA processing protein